PRVRTTPTGLRPHVASHTGREQSPQLAELLLDRVVAVEFRGAFELYELRRYRLIVRALPTPSRLRRRRLRSAPVTRVDLGKYFLQRSRRHPQVGKAGHAGRGDVVALHQLHLASRDRPDRQQFADGSDDLP